MTRKWITFLRPSFTTIFQKIQLTSRVTVFFPYKKRFKMWWKLRVLSCFDDHSYTEIKLPTGYTKSCKMTPKCITNQREMTMKKHRFRCCNAQKRTPSTELRTCMTTRSFCRSRVALLKKRISKSSKVIENLSQMPAARRANSECTLPALQKIELINSETNSIFEPRNQLIPNLIRFSRLEIN